MILDKNQTLDKLFLGETVKEDRHVDSVTSEDEISADPLGRGHIHIQYVC